MWPRMAPDRFWKQKDGCYLWRGARSSWTVTIMLMVSESYLEEVVGLSSSGAVADLTVVENDNGDGGSDGESRKRQ